MEEPIVENQQNSEVTYEQLRSQNQDYLKKIAELSKTIEQMEQSNTILLETYKEQQAMLEVNSTFNAHRENPEENIDLALTYITGTFDAEISFICSKNANDEFTPIYASRQYITKYRSQTKELLDNFNLSTMMPTVLNIVKEGVCIPIVQPNAFEETNLDIKKINLLPISIDRKVNYVLCIVNAQKENRELMRKILPFFADAIERINTSNLIKKMAITDNFTGLYNKDYFVSFCETLKDEELNSLSLVMIDLNRLKYVNDTFGHDAGDTYIKTIASIIKSVFGEDAPFRIGGDEFSIIIKNKSREYVELQVERIKSVLASITIPCKKGNIPNPNVAVGIAHSSSTFDIEDLYRIADEEMYKNKQEFYQNNHIDRRH